MPSTPTPTIAAAADRHHRSRNISERARSQLATRERRPKPKCGERFRLPAEPERSVDRRGVRAPPHAVSASQWLSRPLYPGHTMCLTVRASIPSIRFSARRDVQSPPTGRAQSLAQTRQGEDGSRSPHTKTILLTARMPTSARHMLSGFTWAGSMRRTRARVAGTMRASVCRKFPQRY